MKYAEIHNNVVLHIHNSVPTAWGDISDFNAIPPEQLVDLTAYGYPEYKFYPVVEDAYPAIDYLYTVDPPTTEIDHVNCTVYVRYTTTPKSSNDAWSSIRNERTKKLFRADWTQLPDAPLTEEQKTAYRTYRQALRDITEQVDAFNIVWPQIPE
jgi:hypothetical protein